MNVDRDKLRQDIRLCAHIAGVACDADFVSRSVEAFDDILDSAWMGMRTTTHPEAARKLSWRLIHQRPVPPLERARQAGLRSGRMPPMERLLKALEERFPLIWGLDLDVDGTLEKIWAGFPGGVPIDELLDVPGFPAGVAAVKRVMDRATLVGFHLGKAYLNVYAQVFPQGTLTARRMHDLVAELGFPSPTAAELACATHAFSVYETYPYGREGTSPSRISFSTRCTPDEVPAHLHPLLRRFTDEAPFATGARHFLFYPDYSARGRNFKISTDYLGNQPQILKALLPAERQ
ncbi:aromatic prenyltransferase [Streptomyces huiliensis]|uniref:aromatic prenyltransferase n=1 Tax=Streptomyces huiliensis TaxID=2876027 RepID=UPI001CBD0725|nr:aromatic prenyltransferase [Streptomyces huiliensis]MBZ4321415.1 hypothetical protein [Streptomyces huiliensis]